MWRVVLVMSILAAALPARPALAACLTVGADERLTARCLFDRLLRAPPAEQAAIDPILQRIFARQGRTPGAVGQTTTTPFVQPLLSWSDNINGGNPDRPLDLGGPNVFAPSPPFRKQGVLVGLRAGFTGRHVHRPGGFLDFTFSGSAEYAPRHDLTVLSYFWRACSWNEFGLAWTIDACVTGNEINRDLARDQAMLADLTLGHMFDFGTGQHQRVYAGLRALDADPHSDLSSLPGQPYGQWQYFAGVQSISDRFPFVAVEARFGEPVADTTVLLHETRATVSDRLMGRPFSATARYAYSGGEFLDGGPLFGSRARFDRTLELSVTYNVWRSWYLRLGYRDVDSTVDYFDESEPVVGISIPTIRF
jgi:hypothetical protein